MFDCSAMLQVGKSSICCQFLSSEHVNTYARVGEDPRFEDLKTKEEWYIGNVESFPEDSVEKEVVVAVNGEEARVMFIDHQYGAMKLENLVATYDPHAFLVVLAVDDVASLATVSAL